MIFYLRNTRKFFGAAVALLLPSVQGVQTNLYSNVPPAQRLQMIEPVDAFGCTRQRAAKYLVDAILHNEITQVDSFIERYKNGFGDDGDWRIWNQPKHSPASSYEPIMARNLLNQNIFKKLCTIMDIH